MDNCIYPDQIVCSEAVRSVDLHCMPVYKVISNILNNEKVVFSIIILLFLFPVFKIEVLDER